MIRNYYIYLVFLLGLAPAMAWEEYPIDSAAYEIEVIDGNCYLFGGMHQLLKSTNKHTWENIVGDKSVAKGRISKLFKYQNTLYGISQGKKTDTSSAMSSNMITIANDTIGELWSIPSEYYTYGANIIDEQVFLLGYVRKQLSPVILECAPPDSTVKVTIRIDGIDGPTGFVKFSGSKYFISTVIGSLYLYDPTQELLQEKYKVDGTLDMTQVDAETLFLFSRNGVLRKYDYSAQVWNNVYIGEQWTTKQIIRAGNNLIIAANNNSNQGGLFYYKPEYKKFERFHTFDTIVQRIAVFNDELLVLGIGKLYSKSLDSLTADVADESLAAWQIRADRIEIPEELCRAGYTANVYDINGKLISSKYYNSSEFDASEFSNHNILIIEIIASDIRRQFKCINGQISSN